MMKRTIVAVLLFASAGFAQLAKRFVVPSDSVPTYVNDAGNIGMTILLDRDSVHSNTALSLV